MSMSFGSDFTYISKRKLGDNINENPPAIPLPLNLEEIKEEKLEESLIQQKGTLKRTNSFKMIHDSELDVQPQVSYGGIPQIPENKGNIEPSNNTNNVFKALLEAPKFVSTQINSSKAVENSSDLLNIFNNIQKPLPISSSIPTYSNPFGDPGSIPPQSQNSNDGENSYISFKKENQKNINLNLFPDFPSINEPQHNLLNQENKIMEANQFENKNIEMKSFNIPKFNQFDDKDAIMDSGMMNKPLPFPIHTENINKFQFQSNAVSQKPNNLMLKGNRNELNRFNDLPFSQDKEINQSSNAQFKGIANPPLLSHNAPLFKCSPESNLFPNKGIRNFDNSEESSIRAFAPPIINLPQKNNNEYRSLSFQPQTQVSGFNYSKQEKAREIVNRAKNISITDHYSQRVHTQDIDNNIISIGLNDLKEKSNIMSGERICCKSCEGSLNIYSKNISKDANGQTWICEFCGDKNLIKVEEEEMPKSDIITYLIQSAQQNINIKKEEQDISIIFCIDISGSMGVSQMISGKYKLKYDKSEALKEFNSFGDGSYQWLNSENRNSTYITRIQSVQIAIESQIVSMAKAYPNRKIGIVTFGKDVTIFGDGIKAPKTLAGDKLNNYNELLEESKADANNYLSANISESYKVLLQKLSSIEENGTTALGPGLLASVGLLNNAKPGSKVIICTDGLANVGVGSIENIELESQFENAKKFYEDVGHYSKDKGFIISILSIADTECKLEKLSPIADLTGGDIVKVNPLNLNADFADVLQQNIVATNVVMKVKLHKALKFTDEEKKDLSQDNSLLKREIGNVIENQNITFRYAIKSITELKANGVDLKEISQFPFQAQIFYTSLEGNKCVRYITKMQKSTYDYEKAKEGQNDQVVYSNAIQQTTTLARQGNYRGAQANIKLWTHELKPEAKTYFSSETAPMYSSLQMEQYHQIEANPHYLGQPQQNNPSIPPAQSSKPAEVSDSLITFVKDLEKKI